MTSGCSLWGHTTPPGHRRSACIVAALLITQIPHRRSSVSVMRRMVLYEKVVGVFSRRIAVLKVVWGVSYPGPGQLSGAQQLAIEQSSSEL